MPSSSVIDKMPPSSIIDKMMSSLVIDTMTSSVSNRQKITSSDVIRHCLTFTLSVVNKMSNRKFPYSFLSSMKKYAVWKSVYIIKRWVGFEIRILTYIMRVQQQLQQHVMHSQNVYRVLMILLLYYTTERCIISERH